MVVLKRAAPFLFPVLFAAGGCALFGCAMVGGLFSPRPTISGFNHQVHAEEVGLACDDCHEDVGDSDKPGMPFLDFCLACHEDLDEDKPEELRATAFFDEDGESTSAHVTALADEIVFSHLAHANHYDLECADCHAGIESSRAITAGLAMTMASCVDCHEAKEAGVSATGVAAGECAYCHSEIDETWVPPSHEQAWTQFHGTVFRSGDTAASNQCSLCHDEWSCAECHQEVPPRDHNNQFRQVGHGVAATIDRTRCAVCHRTDYCQRCHEHTAPRNHTGGFGSPRNRHCLGCHFPLRNESCFTCHKDTRSHDFAPEQPSWHTPGMNCRQCHGVEIPLRHPDNGGDCNICHR